MRFAFTHGAQESFDGKVGLPEGQTDVKLYTGKSTGAQRFAVYDKGAKLWTLHIFDFGWISLYKVVVDYFSSTPYQAP